MEKLALEKVILYQATDLNERYLFFLKALQQDGCADRNIGRQALALARAEQWIESRQDYYFKWIPEDDPDRSWMSAEQLRAYHDGNLEVDTLALERNVPWCPTCQGSGPTRQCVAQARIVHYGSTAERRVAEARLAYRECWGDHIAALTVEAAV